MTEHSPLAAVAWPAGRKSLVLRILVEGGVLPRAVLRASAEGAGRLIVETESFPEAAVSRFEAAVAAGKAEDSTAGFCRFASMFFSRLDDFRQAWAPAGSDETHLLIALGDLRADPEGWMRRVLAFLDPSGAPAEEEIRALAKVADQAVKAEPPPDLTTFRHYEADLFARLERMSLRRDVVQDVFRKFMGRDLDEHGILHFQALASVTRLGEALARTPEFARRKQRWAASSGERAIIHLHVPKTAGTSLNTILSSNWPANSILDAHAGDLGPLESLSQEERRKLRVIRGHLQHGIHTMLPQDVVYLCVLRRPGPRIFSFYRYVQRMPTHPLHGVVVQQNLGFGGFLSLAAEQRPDLRNEIDNGQMRRIAGHLTAGAIPRIETFQTAVQHLFAPNMIFGLTEHFSLFLAKLAEQNLLHLPLEMEQNVAPPGPDYVSAVAGLTPEERAVHDDFCSWDEELYSMCKTFLFGPSTSED